MDEEHRPALHVAFYRCIWLFEAISIRVSRLDERIGIRLRSALASTRGRVAKPAVGQRDAAAEADLAQ